MKLVLDKDLPMGENDRERFLSVFDRILSYFEHFMDLDHMKHAEISIYHDDDPVEQDFDFTGDRGSMGVYIHDMSAPDTAAAFSFGRNLMQFIFAYDAGESDTDTIIGAKQDLCDAAGILAVDVVSGRDDGVQAIGYMQEWYKGLSEIGIKIAQRIDYDWRELADMAGF